MGSAEDESVADKVIDLRHHMLNDVPLKFLQAAWLEQRITEFYEVAAQEVINVREEILLRAFVRHAQNYFKYLQELAGYNDTTV